MITNDVILRRLDRVQGIIADYYGRRPTPAVEESRKAVMDKIDELERLATRLREEIITADAEVA
jgi:hypothetical protein